MALSKERKNEIIKDFQLKDGDTGSPEVQIAVLTAQLTNLTLIFKHTFMISIHVAVFTK